jgi:hypothetical protein
MALLHDDVQSKRTDSDGDSGSEEENGESIDRRVEHFTRAIAPVLLPMINSLGALEVDDASPGLRQGEAT